MIHKLMIFRKPTVFSVMAYKKCNILDAAINSYLDIGIEGLLVTNFWIHIVFCDGTAAMIWNENIYSGWLSEGYIGDYAWHNKRPSRATMRRFKQHIENFIAKK